MLNNRIIVFGAGNLLLKDEGIGVHIARALQEQNLPDNVAIIDGGTSSDSLTDIEPADKLIIIDAVQAGGKPGTVYRFHPDDLAEDPGRLISLHEAGVMSGLRMMSLLRNGPKEIIIFGIQPKEIDWGMELSPELRDKIPEIVRAVLKEIGGDEEIGGVKEGR